MEDIPTPPVVSEESATPPMSLGARLFNVYASPGEVFDSIKPRPVSHLNWILPVILSMIAAMVYGFVVFSQPGVLQKNADKMRVSMNKNFEKVVTSGKMTQQQADDQVDTIVKKMGPMMKWFSAAGAMVFSVVWVFLVAFVLWLIGKFALKSPLGFLKALEIAGLASMILALGNIISLQLAAHYEDMLRTPGPSLLLEVLDDKNKVHLLLSSLNLVMFWYLSILSLGLAKLTSTSFFKPAAWLFGIWAVFTLGPILLFGGK
jgi:hypothetical protein